LGVTQRSLGRTQVVWGLALFGLVACAGFLAREGGSQVSAAPALVPGTPAQTSLQSATASQAAQPGARTGVAAPPATPNGRGPWEWWKDDAVKKEIGLRPNQAAEIDRIYQRRLKDMDPYVQALVQEKAVLVKMIADRVVDDTQLDLELNKYDAMRVKLESSRTLMLYRISKVLDADQYSKLQAIIDRHEAAGRRGRGGASAPSPFGLPR
jgi:Spy/CpxP family protein refolding chaperone